MSHALTHTHLYANQNQHHYCSALIALYKSKHNPISAKEKKNTKHCLFSPNSKEDPNHAKLKKNQISQSDLNEERVIGQFFVIN